MQPSFTRMRLYLHAVLLPLHVQFRLPILLPPPSARARSPIHRGTFLGYRHYHSSARAADRRSSRRSTRSMGDLVRAATPSLPPSLYYVRATAARATVAVGRRDRPKRKRRRRLRRRPRPPSVRTKRRRRRRWQSRPKSAPRPRPTRARRQKYGLRCED